MTVLSVSSFPVSRCTHAGVCTSLRPQDTALAHLLTYLIFIFQGVRPFLRDDHTSCTSVIPTPWDGLCRTDKTCNFPSLCSASQVDVTSVHSPTGLPWMRLVQAAANSKEQNLEAYLENSQLYYRSTRKISKNEELLVWYDEELSSLLGFNEIKAQSPQNGKYKIADCRGH